MKKNIPLYGVLGIALLATFGSLYFSEVADFPPCTLCWYQRIFMYPIVLIALTGLIEKDDTWTRYALPLVIPGALIAVFHNLLYYNIILEAAAPCVAGISCTTKYIEWFGFVTIPLLSLAAFIGVMALTILAKRQAHE
jgi:disulfide bond formation protein DsbB